MHMACKLTRPFMASAVQKIKKLLLSVGAKKHVLRSYSPMHATKTKKVFDNKDFVFEIKWDGYRIIATKNKTKVELRTRIGLNYTSIYSSVSDTLKKLPYSGVVDGEVIMLDEEGKPSYIWMYNSVLSGFNSTFDLF